MQETAYHYKECGLDDIYLLNGFKWHETPYGRGVSIENIDALHLAIGEHLIKYRKALSPKDFRFLRKNMDLTQDNLGKKIGVTGQTIARYEKGETEIPGPSDRLVRVVYAFHLLPPETKLEMVEKVQRLSTRSSKNDEDIVPAYFKASGKRWKEKLSVAA